MGFDISSLPALYRHGFDTVIDVRSPAEFAEDHIPGAISLPVLSDAERARVGTIYVQDSPFRARKIGAALVARNAARHIEGPLAAFDGAWRPLVYCWRGGQRSGAFASILAQIGWRSQTISGGYRSYRRQVVAALYDDPAPARVILLDGYTGTAKTALLPRLAQRGAQVIDLEGLARHRGSVFGGAGGGQPSQKRFESALARAWVALDPDRPVVIEAESSKIGERLIPPAIWAAMGVAPRIVIEAPVAARADFLTRAYADLGADPEALCATLDTLRRLQGGATVDRWQDMVRAGDLSALAAELIASHYDPRYARSRGRADANVLARFQTDDLADAALDRLADEIVARIGKARSIRDA